MKAKFYSTEYVDGKVAQREEDLVFAPEKMEQELCFINLYPEISYQTILGFGGAVTDAAVSVLEQMSEREQEQILREYFTEEGMGYCFVRTPIDSCDFSRGQYCAYNAACDGNLDREALERGAGTVLKYLKKICEISSRPLQVMLTPWSPPEALKTNGDRTGGGSLKKEAYGDWAAYICAYIQEYRRRGIPVTMLSVQNEPNAIQTWDSCLFTAAQEKEFVRDYLYPALQKNGLQDIELYIWDHNKERIYERTRDIVDEQTDAMVNGVAFHWYSGDHFEGVGLVHEQYPDKKLLFSEGCIEYSRFDEDNQLGNAQMYAHDMIGNFNAGMNVFLDWNIVLDDKGGPNYVNNLCESPVMYHTASHSCVKMLSWSYLAHFSRFIKPGAKRIAYTKYSSELDVLAVKNPDGGLAVVVCSRQPEAKKALFRLDGMIGECEIPANGMVTVVISEAHTLR